MAIKHETILFDKCLGLNDGVDITAPQVNIQTGITELKACSGITMADNGKVKGADSFSLISTVLADNIVSVSAKYRCFVQAGTGIYTYSNGVFTAVTFGAGALAVVGTVQFVHTELDVRFVSDGVVYKVLNGTNAAVVANVGVWPGPATSIAWQKMPLFSGGFTYNGVLYIWSGGFLQYCPPWTYDCWNVGDDFIALNDTVVQATAIPGCIVVLGTASVITLTGSGPADFVFKQYPIIGAAKTLVAGYSNKTGFVVMFVGDDGIYAVTGDGQITNLTDGRYSRSLAGSYVGAIITDSKYLAVHSTAALSIEYDFENKSVLHGGYTGISALTQLNKVPLCSVGKSLYTTVEQTTTSASLTLPLTDYGSTKRKRVRSLYITGVIKGTMTVSVYDAAGNSKSEVKVIDGFINNYHITGYGGITSNLLGVRIDVVGTFFFLDKVRAVVYEVQ